MISRKHSRTVTTTLPNAGSGSSQGHFFAVIFGTEVYGVQRSWDGFIEGLKEHGFNVTVICASDGPMTESVLERNWETICLGLPKMPPVEARGAAKLKRLVLAAKLKQLVLRVLWQFKMVSLLKNVFADKTDPIVLFQNPLEALAIAYAAYRAKGHAYWLLPNTVSNDYPLDLNRRLYRFAFKRLGLVPVANSHYTDTTLGKGEFERHIVHLGLSPDEFSPAGEIADRSILGIPASDAVIGVFARLTPEKGQSLFLESLLMLKDTELDFHVLILGGPIEGKYYTKLNDLASKLRPRVHILGPQLDVAPWYRLCDVIVNSRIDPEPFGLSVIEAMLTGKPVWAHALGGPAETVVDGVTGWHVKEPTVEAYSKGVSRMLADRDKWQEMGEAGRQRALQHFTQDAMIQRLLATLFEPGFPILHPIR